MRFSRPVIAIPCACYPDSWYTPAHGNAMSYIRAIEAAGGIPALIPQTNHPEVLEAHYQSCDGLMFAGGTDIAPQHYYAAAHALLEEPDLQQDALELSLARRAIADSKPVFGICRGIQLLNVAMGGSLYQDLPSEYANALNHSESTEQRKMAHLAHMLSLREDAWLAEHLGTAQLMVNTLHHQGIRQLAAGLRITGRAPDGVVEAIEGTGRGFILGVQSHPEELWEHADQRWAAVFAAFVCVCRSKQASLVKA